MSFKGPSKTHIDTHLLVNGFQLLQRLFACDGVDQDEGVALGDGEALHGWELVAPCGVCDLQGAHAFITADHLPVGVLHRGDVGVPESSLDKAQDQGALPHSSRSEHHHTVVVALLRHFASAGLRQRSTETSKMGAWGGEGKVNKTVRLTQREFSMTLLFLTN